LLDDKTASADGTDENQLLSRLVRLWPLVNFILAHVLYKEMKMTIAGQL